MQYSPDQYSIVKFIEENKHLDLKAIIKAAENEADEPVPPRMVKIFEATETVGV
jgi:hypothetical protein